MRATRQAVQQHVHLHLLVRARSQRQEKHGQEQGRVVRLQVRKRLDVRRSKTATTAKEEQGGCCYLEVLATQRLARRRGVFAIVAPVAQDPQPGLLCILFACGAFMQQVRDE